MGYTGDKKREYQLAWVKKRRMTWINANGPCVLCGSIERLEMDHIDRATKISSHIWTWTQEKRESELKKCQVLCHSCHRSKTLSEITHPPRHGTEHEYRKGCRCDLCRIAKVAAVNEWRWKTGRRKRRFL